MPVLHIQIEPDRSPDLDLDAVLALFATAAELADAELEIRGLDGLDDQDADGDEDDGPLLRFDFRTLDLPRLWAVLQGQVFWDETIGPDLAMAAIVTCDGRYGGDDDLLLHHHDRSRIPDTLDGL